MRLSTICNNLLTTNNEFLCWAVGDILRIPRHPGECDKEMSFRVYYALKQTFPDEITKPFNRERDILDVWVNDEIRYHTLAGLNRRDFRIGFLKLLIEKYGDVDLVV